jgi:hypothetical protein
LSFAVSLPHEAVSYAIALDAAIKDILEEVDLDNDLGASLLTAAERIAGDNPDGFGSGCDFEVNDEGCLWVHDIDGSPDVSVVADIVQATLAAFDIKEHVLIEFANTCSRPRVGCFGGGSVVVRAAAQHWWNQTEWVDAILAASALPAATQTVDA